MYVERALKLCVTLVRSSALDFRLYIHNEGYDNPRSIMAPDTTRFVVVDMAFSGEIILRNDMIE